MIPLRLRLRNFLCYRDNVPPLDFAGIHLACLTGPNGHGKSALLDAVTWALWGKARAKRDDELIHLGQSEMEVEFTFSLGGSVYRVVRKRDSSQRGRTLLDLQSQHDGAFQSIAEPTVRATQEQIVRLLRMDYETFTNSAFLLQGRADAFTTRTPAERKQVLAEILGLGRYDEYEERARDKAREKDRRLAELDGLLRDIDRELDREPAYQAELAQAEAAVTASGAAVNEAETSLRDLRHRLQALQLQQNQLQDLERRLAQARRELSETEAERQERHKRLVAYEQVLAERTRIEEGYAALLAARQDEAAWNERLARYAELQARQRELEKVAEQARRDLELALERLETRLAELERRAAGLPDLQRDLDDVRRRLEHLAERRAEREATQSRLQAQAEESAGLKERNDRLRADMDALKEKLELLAREAGQACCPLCGQPLAAADRLRLEANLNAEGKALADTHRLNAARRQEIAAAAQRLQAELKLLDEALAGQPAEQRREAQLEQSLADARSAAEEVARVRLEKAGLEGRLKARAYALPEQEALARLADELASLGYDTDAHTRSRSEVAAHAAFEPAYHRLVQALERLDEERSALAELQARTERWQAVLADDLAQRDLLAREVASLPEAAAQVESQARALEEVQAQASKARLSLGAARQKLDHCRYLAAERGRHLADRQRAAEEKAIFEELRVSFGKKGLQAMIIETAIPEIEYEANQLLSRMTDGRMHLRLETQRETLKGDTIETLYIHIADELGTRPYELFSGGEAFRVNFSVRIALSKLLARRAGAQLQWLVVDEGFGTQDAEGRERLVEAINSIQDDFARILVITHIEELKDAFPVRIEVAKTSEGSTYCLA